MPTRKEVTDWRTEKLTEWADQLDAETQKYENQLGRVLIHFHGTEWSGKAHDAAADRFTEENDQGRKLSIEIRDVAVELRRADERLANERRILLNRVADAENDRESPIPLTVDDQWTVAVSYLGAELSREDQQKVSDRIDHHQGLIRGAHTSLADAASEVGTRITAAAQEIRVRGDLLGNGLDVAILAPGDAGALGAQDGKAVREAIRTDGTVDTTALDQISGRLPTQPLTDSELRALAAGEQVSTLPASVQSYYREFYQNAGKDGILALNDQLRAQEQAGNPAAANRRDALANGLMLVSNDKVGTGRNPDGTLRSPGGYQQLPEDVRRLISTRIGGPDQNSNTYPTSPPENEAAAQSRFLRESSSFAELLKQSNPGYEPGVEFSRELTRQAAALGAPGGHPEVADLPGGTVQLSAMEDTMRDYLEVSSRNEQATAELLTGKPEPGSPPLENGYDPRRVFQPLLQYDWTDSNGQKPPQLFTWIGEDAVPRPPTDGDPGVSLAESKLAGKAATGLADLLTQNGKDGYLGSFESLMNMPDKDNQSLGQTNPGLTQQLAGAMIPYLDAMALAPGKETNGFEWRGADPEIQAIRLSTLLNTDPVASGAWNAAIIDRTNDYAAQYADLLGKPSNDRDQIANAAGRLLGYQEQGLRAEAFDRGLDEKQVEKERVEKMKLGVDIAGSILSDTAGSKVPVAGTLIDIAGKLVGENIKEDDKEIPATQQEIVQNELSAQHYYRMLEVLSQRDPAFFETPGPGAAPVPSSWLDDGKLKGYNEIVGPEGTHQRTEGRAVLQSAASEWVGNAGVNVDAFSRALNDQRMSMAPKTYSVDDYVSRILRGA